MVIAIVGILIACLLPAVRGSRESARRTLCSNNLKNIVLALSNYEDTYHALPPAYTIDKDCKPLHSWRTLLLPFLEQAALYQTIDLSKPWNDPVNAEACNTALSVFRCPSAMCPPNYTTYRAVVTEKSCLRATDPRPLLEITARHSDVLVLIETDSEHAVPWMAPSDADEALILALGKNKLDHPGGSLGAFLDGTVDFLPASMSAEERLALISMTKKAD